MWKPIITTSAALLIASTSLAAAQSRGGDRDGGRRFDRGYEDRDGGRRFDRGYEDRNGGRRSDRGYEDDDDDFDRGFQGRGSGQRFGDRRFDRGGEDRNFDRRGEGQRYGRDFGGRDFRPDADDMRAFADARLAALKAGLALKPEQEKFWPAFEAAARDIQNMRIQRMTNPPAGEPQRLSSLEMLQRRANAMVERGTALKKLADAAVPLYGSLDDGQKRRFDMLGRFGGGYRQVEDRTDDRERARNRDDDGRTRGRDGDRRRDRRDRDSRSNSDERPQSTEQGNQLP